jgi:hypothetical protein
MDNYEIDNDEVILYEGKVGYNKNYIDIDFKLTSKKMIFEKQKGFLKKTKELINIVPLDKIKVYNDSVQIKQKMNELQVQTLDENFSIYASGILEAKKIITKIIDTITGTTISKRGSQKLNGAFDLVDETLGLNTRDTVKGVIQNGIKGTLINGIENKKK